MKTPPLLVQLFAALLLFAFTHCASADMFGSDGADTVYLTTLDSGNGHFARYDVSSNTWLRLNDYDTDAQMAVSSTGDLYALNASTSMIQIYAPITDAWSDVQPGPPVSRGLGNLEITNDGRFFYTQNFDTSLHYTDLGGNWHTSNLGIRHNSMGDYDPTTGQYVIGELFSDNARLVDTNSLAVTEFLDGPTRNGETARFSSIVNDQYYFQYKRRPVYSYNLTNNSQPAQSLEVTPPQAFYNASVADRNNNGLYVADINGVVFDFLDLSTNTFIDLADYGVNIGNHSSLALVNQEIPEPTTFTLAAFALVGLVGFRRRKRRLLVSTNMSVG